MRKWEGGEEGGGEGVGEGGEEGGGEADEDRNMIKVGKEVGRG